MERIPNLKGDEEKGEEGFISKLLELLISCALLVFFGLIGKWIWNSLRSTSTSSSKPRRRNRDNVVLKRRSSIPSSPATIELLQVQTRRRKTERSPPSSTLLSPSTSTSSSTSILSARQQKKRQAQERASAFSSSNDSDFEAISSSSSSSDSESEEEEYFEEVSPSPSPFPSPRLSSSPSPLSSSSFTPPSPRTPRRKRTLSQSQKKEKKMSEEGEEDGERLNARKLKIANRLMLEELDFEEKGGSGTENSSPGMGTESKLRIPFQEGMTHFVVASNPHLERLPGSLFRRLASSSSLSTPPSSSRALSPSPSPRFGSSASCSSPSSCSFSFCSSCSSSVSYPASRSRSSSSINPPPSSPSHRTRSTSICTSSSTSPRSRSRSRSLSSSISPYLSSPSLISSLVVLSLKNNRLTSLPEEIGLLSSLKVLRLDQNQLTTLPETIFNQMRKLRRFNVNNNLLILLPPTLSDLHHLKKLDISHNLLGSLPTGLHKVKLKELIVHPNPLCISPPQSVITSGSAVLKWLQFTEEQEKMSPKFVSRGSHEKLAHLVLQRMKKKALSPSEHPLLHEDTKIYFTLHPGVAECVNERQYMEDRHILLPQLVPKHANNSKSKEEEKRRAWPLISVLGVFDGHGGSHTVDYVSRNVLDFVTYNPNWLASEEPTNDTTAPFEEGIQFTNRQKGKKDTYKYQEQTKVPILDSELMRWVGKAILEGFKTLDEECLRIAKLQRIFDGSTALLSFLIQRDNSILLLLANCGDCRAVLCRDGKAVRLTKDHKPQDPIEKARIESQKGGYISRNSHSETWRVQGSLAVSRSFGDLDVKLPYHYVTAEPELTAFSLSPPSDSFLILGSDGLWDVIGDQKAVELVMKSSSSNGMNPVKSAESLMRKAIDENSKDNITVVVAFFSLLLATPFIRAWGTFCSVTSGSVSSCSSN